MSGDNPYSKRISRLATFVGPVKAAVLELPGSPVGRVYSSFARQLGVLNRTLTYGVRARRITWPTISADLRGMLRHRYLWVFAVVLGMALAAPTLWRGWGVEDDVLHRTMLLSSSLPEALSGLFVFLDPSLTPQLMDQGAIPWWALDSVRVAFFRPLSALTLWLDYQLWPDIPELMHVHNILWYGGVCALAALLYRRLMGRSVAAGLAALLFAADIGHMNTVASLAARNALLAVFFGILTLVFHDRWCRGGRKMGLPLASLCLALSLLSAEAGLATMAYLVAYALCMDRGRWRWRLSSLAPYVVIVVIWRLMYQYLGYGAWGADFYIDPGRELTRFAAAVLERGPVLIWSQWTLLDPAIYALLSMWASRAFWLVALLFLAFVGLMLWPLLRKNRVARFWGLGMLIAVVPACAISLSSGRLLIFVGVGAFGLMAQLAGGLIDRASWLPARRAWRTAAWWLGGGLLALHLVIFPILTPSMQLLVESSFQAITDLGSLPQAQGRDVVIVNMPSPGQFMYVPEVRKLRGQSVPAHMRVLAPGCFAVEVTRIDAHTLIVRPDEGYLVPPGARPGKDGGLFPIINGAYGYQHSDGFFRSSAHPMMLGEQVNLTGMQAEVTALTADGRPAEARIRFDVPLEDQSLVWLQWDWQENAYVPFRLPQVGETVRVAGSF